MRSVQPERQGGGGQVPQGVVSECELWRGPADEKIDAEAVPEVTESFDIEAVPSFVMLRVSGGYGS